MNNPLLDSFNLPPFSSIRSKHILPAVKYAIENCQETINKILEQNSNNINKKFTWQNLCQPIQISENKLWKIWSIVTHLNNVKNSESLRKTYEECLPLISYYSTWISQNTNLYNAYCNLKNSDNYLLLNDYQKKDIDNTLRDFKLCGVDLPDEKKKEYSNLITELLELSTQYDNNVLDATKEWFKIVDKQELSGVPKDIISIAEHKANSIGKTGCLITLDISNYVPILTYCDNQEIRKDLYYAYNTRASEIGKHSPKLDNTYIMEQIVLLRHKLANLLGFSNYAHQSLITKMAQDPEKVLDFLLQLTNSIKENGKKEFKNLKEFAKDHYNISDLYPWDIPYYSEKQKLYLYSTNNELLRQYFPEKQVIYALFKILNKIYGIFIKERYDVEKWHNDVRFFDIFNNEGKLYGSIYLDIYVRDNKRPGAWMDECMTLMYDDNSNTRQNPVAYIICNFNKPIKDSNEPVLLTHTEVITLFHEFGHALHHVLTKVDILGISGIHGIPWDAIELPSQLMENFCWKQESLEIISKHYKTNEPLPKKTLDNLLNTKNYLSALSILRQIELSMFDMYIHYKYILEKKYKKILDVLKDIRNYTSVIPNVEWNRLPNSFSHIFSGGYAAGYYSYLWSEILSADIWEKFEEEGIFNKNTGKLFLDTILSSGGSEDPMILFKKFRGREPKIEAMLRSRGIIKNNNEHYK